MSELACRELVELVSDYLDDALAPADRVRFEEHLAACEGCRTHVEQLRATIALAGGLSEDDLDPEAREALLAAFRGWHA